MFSFFWRACRFCVVALELLSCRSFAARHYFITRVVSDGVDAFQVAYIAGTSVDQIQKTYFDTSSELTAKTVKEQRSSGKRAGLKVVRGGRSQGAI